MEQRYPERHILMHSYAKKFMSFISLPVFMAHQNEKGWRNWPLSERRGLPHAPPICVTISLVRRGVQSTWQRPGLAVKMQGFRLLLPLTQQPPKSSRQKTPLHYTQKRIINAICQRLDMVEGQEVRRRRYRKETVRRNSVPRCIKWSCLPSKTFEKAKLAPVQKRPRF